MKNFSLSSRSLYWVLVVAFFLVLFFLLQKSSGKTQVSPAPTTVQQAVVSKVVTATSVKNLSDIRYVKIGGINLSVELALTPAEQQQGLSGRSSLTANTGMLFAFDHSGKYSFWMKSMKFPLDIIWINQDLQVVHIVKNALPSSYPKSFASTQNAKYILEVAGGFSEQK